MACTKLGRRIYEARSMKTLLKRIIDLILYFYIYNGIFYILRTVSTSPCI